jgi:TetR/AcrR family transcriptional regulator, transcriptional repressor for nem operon
MGRTSDAHQRLMSAALDLIWSESYGAVTIDDICNKAGVKKGSFYYFFRSKSDLAVAALENMWNQDWKPRMDQMFSPSLDGLTRITKYLEGMYPRAVETFKKTGRVLGCPACSVGSEVSKAQTEVNAKAREIISRKRRYYESAIRDAMAEGLIEQGDATQKAQSFSCLIEGTVAQARIMNDPEVMKTLPTAALDLLHPKVPVTTTPTSTAAR